LSFVIQLSRWNRRAYLRVGCCSFMASASLRCRAVNLPLASTIQLRNQKSGVYVTERPTSLLPHSLQV
jgi:hypothetical protein